MPYGYSSLKIQLLNILINKIRKIIKGGFIVKKLFAILVCGLMITVSGCGSNKVIMKQHKAVKCRVKVCKGYICFCFNNGRGKTYRT